MHMMALETIEEQTCLKETVFKSILFLTLKLNYKNNKIFKGPLWNAQGTFRWWFGATDTCVEGTFMWCYRNTAVVRVDRPSLTFISSEPNDYGGNEDCLQTYDPGALTMNDNDCATSMGYFCEVF